MTDTTPPNYRHTQKGPWCLLLYSIGALPLAVAGLAWYSSAVPFVPVILLASGGVMLALGACFQQLTVADEGDRLAVRFGPLPLFAKRIRYDDMRGVEAGQTTVLDSWGVHYSPRGGWVWNIWGWDCVLIHHGGGKTWVGTDDPENLLRFLRTKLPSPAGDGRPPLARQEVGR
jgi:hypothetical protein